ncbi:GNAT family N-acetyltransferase [Enterovirga rhinocerotis]|uniref:Acetyltransferase (GNAT) family protein n=1 Tax=Enterovirga rhinocerotis TaxID=1339210 RepID=A0A4R7CA45_9HYPH|nr:GNAT family N-acetyltransferase [Enterovirga rhinocerotis]TDR94942.1 acetyltransferase (GNAT) family protein [Enterovirga rhinocerotis]
MTREPLLARQPRRPPVPRDGIVDLPRGKIAAIATYLELHAPPPAATSRAPLPGRLERLRDDVPRYRALYSRIGAPWLWFTRAVLTDAALLAQIRHPDVEAFVYVEDGVDTALIEIDMRRAGEGELVFFGLVPEACGRGLGRALLAEAVARAFARPIKRLWLHTCTLDHPAAMPLYLRAGFLPYRRAIEIADDPRLGGYLPHEAAPNFPIL